MATIISNIKIICKIFNLKLSCKRKKLSFKIIYL